MGIKKLADKKSAKIIALLDLLRRDQPDVADRIDLKSDEMAEPTDPGAVAASIEAQAYGSNPSRETWNLGASRAFVRRRSDVAARGDLMTVPEDTYTFLATTPQGDPVFMDIAVLSTEGAALRHCAQILQSHASGSLVEVWRGAGLIMTIAREPCMKAAVP